MTETLRQIAVSFGVDRIERHIFLCTHQTKPKCCELEAGLASWEFLRHPLGPTTPA